MFFRARNRMTAWLGLIAMWIVVLAPLVSQLVVSAHMDDPATAALCSVVQPVAGDAHDSQHGDLLAACGYCDLLADHPALPAVVGPTLLLIVLIAAVVVPALSTRFTPLGAFPSGRPRAPPAFSLPSL
ncbi:Protein of unknown function [Paraburkholderia caballeronis]|uniref:DUF2946 domain-containing protein n=2 Tax=Paraburkholderia caballeronis TaxID=416943 RepID=A0A1H7F093_9BURK|nr:DUF2946 domain-containing protein [Paraburkholderia caballeronis]PXW23857.1 hypothetical protein C7403_10816 [Paraburkholderia caballeronis]PXW99621.1 hypothetical protein C7407_10816 [Paraburkholderia caballeronis]RAJ96575.1 hypothetical protein C7409_10816 [Paraburkholderia caballeronis]SEE80180.1 Protein of unknown function [Paraburkholderia caballeronis]SEK18777.1 Protein of unknown function [Paraburkholderia caballeronis]